MARHLSRVGLVNGRETEAEDGAADEVAQRGWDQVLLDEDAPSCSGASSKKKTRVQVESSVILCAIKL